jgi:hypothetical protein
MRTTATVLALALAFASAPRAQEPVGLRLPASWAALAIDAALPDAGTASGAPPAREAGKSYFIPAAEIVGFDVLLNLYDRHHYGCCDYASNLGSIRRNLGASWDVDRDPFTVNQLGHPYQGSMYHGFARSSGLNFWEALGYTFAGSAFWEIAGETTPPSRNDQINTGIGGSFLGEALFRMANLVLDRESRMSPFWREVGATVLSPPLGFNRLVFGDKFARFDSRDPLYFARLQVGFSGTAHNDSGFSTTKLRRDEGLVDFSIDYGLPGKSDYEYRRPFDYFSFQATASSANGFENALTRGLLIGKEYRAGKDYRGVWGLYGSYDYFAPQTFRLASTAVSLGTTGQWWPTRSIAVLGTVLAGVGYAAVGSVRPSDDREFHYGVAPQALASLRVIFREKAALDVTARGYYVSRVAAAQRGGHENVARVDVSFTYRIRGQHGISIKYLGNSRDVFYPDLGDRSQHHGTVGIFYTHLGHDLFGASE